MKFNHFVGIDVSKKTFDVAIRESNGSFIHSFFSNDRKGLRQFFKMLKEHKIEFSNCLVCLEHTGIYTHLILKVLYDKGINIWLEQAINIKRSLGLQRGKSDKVDSERIAEYSFRFKDCCILWKPSRDKVKQLKSYLTMRFSLIKSKKQLNAPLSELSDTNHEYLKESKRILKPVLNKIQAQIQEIEKKINDLITGDIKLNRQSEIITSVDGVGKVTAWNMIVYTNEFRDFKSSRQFACYSGVVPFEYSSGTSIKYKARVSHFANKRMKELLHMSALSATIMEGELNDYYNRKVEDGKNKMLVINNIRNKIIHRIFSCINQNRKYEKSYNPKLV